MIAAGRARRAATYLTWLPGRDAVLTQTPLAEVFGRSPESVSDYCLSVMSGAEALPQSAQVTWFQVLATAVTSVAVLMLLGLDWPRPTRRLVVAFAGLIITQGVLLGISPGLTVVAILAGLAILIMMQVSRHRLGPAVRPEFEEMAA